MSFLQTAFVIDNFASRKGGVRVSSAGRDTSLWYYLPRLDPSIIRVFHTDYTEEARGELLMSKALSGLLCVDPIASNANKCILVNREAALWAFAGNYPHGLLGHCALSLSQGINDPLAISDNLGRKSLQGSSSISQMSDLLKKP